MKEIDCNHCGDTVIVANEPGEMVVNGETPLEHIHRTGHAANSPVMRQCNDCENVWPYTGSADRPTCPNCAGKRTEPVNDE